MCKEFTRHPSTDKISEEFTGIPYGIIFAPLMSEKLLFLLQLLAKLATRGNSILIDSQKTIKTIGARVDSLKDSFDTS